MYEFAALVSSKNGQVAYLSHALWLTVDTRHRVAAGSKVDEILGTMVHVPRTAAVDDQAEHGPQ